MQSQLKIICCLALLRVIFLPVQSFAEVNWGNYSHPKMEIQPYSSAQGEVLSSPIPFFNELGELIWGWDPQSELKKTSDPIYLESSGGLSEIMRSLFISFNVNSTQHFRKVWFKPTAGLKFRGLLGLHDTQSKRPLVIIRMGVYGNVDDITGERFMVKAAYEDLGANVLVLENLTSHSFISQNQNISFGGVDEGLQTFLAMHYLKQAGFDNLVSSWHILSISLGGQGNFVTALLDQQNGHLLKSMALFCPLINLEATFAHHSRPGFKNVLADLWSAERLAVLRERYKDEPELKMLWKSLIDRQPRFTPTLMKIMNRDRKKPLLSAAEVEQQVPGMQWPSKFKWHIENSKSFYELNNFWSSYYGVKTPIMIYTTPDDPLVINKINSELIFRGVLPGDFASVNYHRLSKGTHCGLPPVYKWDYIVKLVRDGLGL